MQKARSYRGDMTSRCHDIRHDITTIRSRFLQVISKPFRKSLFFYCLEILSGNYNSPSSPPPRGGTPYNGLYGEAPPEMGTLFKLAVYKRVGISRVGVQKRDGKTDF